MRWATRVLPFLLVGVFGLLLYHVFPGALMASWGVAIKLRGDAPGCSWRRMVTFHHDQERFLQLLGRYETAISSQERDPGLDIERFTSPRRPFWISRAGKTLRGNRLLAVLLAEHDWIQEQNPRQMVGPGDVVIDCGAHVGVFTSKALELGAARVVAVEPDPVNLECLRRNLAAEIAQGRVIVVPKGVWSSTQTLKLHRAVFNSGMGSVVHDQGGSSLEIPVTTIDQLVADLALPRVDYIKMDIEGAEREALAGAAGALRRFRPRLMLDSYHEPDDAEVLPRIIRAAHADYSVSCGPCEAKTLRPALFVPHATFYQ